jgi:hypothetical protein
MEQSEKFKLNCLKFILENKISKEGFTDYDLAQQLNIWAECATMQIVDKKEEIFEVTPDMGHEIAIEKIIGGSIFEDPKVKQVLRAINRNPERMKKLGNVAANSKNFEPIPDAQ